MITDTCNLYSTLSESCSAKLLFTDLVLGDEFHLEMHVEPIVSSCRLAREMKTIHLTGVACRSDVGMWTGETIPFQWKPAAWWSAIST